MVIKQFSVPGGVLLVEKKIFDLIGLFPEKIFAEDIHFYLRVIGLNLLIFIDEPVAYYRVHVNNTVGNEKYDTQINLTFIYSYLVNIKYYDWRMKLRIMRKLAGWTYSYFRTYVRRLTVK